MTNPQSLGAGARLSAAKAALLSKRLRGETGASASAGRITPRPPGISPLSFSQLRLWFLDQLEPGSALYNIPAGFWLKGALDTAALEQSLNEIIKRHEVLRARFPAIDGEPAQIISPHQPLTLAVESILAAAPAEKKAEALARAREEALRPFDLASGPLIRARLYKLTIEPGADRDAFDYLMTVTLHHIVADAWSIEVLVRELEALYSAFVAGRAFPLKELPAHYADYAYWQRKCFEEGALNSQLAYWRERLFGLSGVLGLPVDNPRPHVRSHGGGSCSLRLSYGLSQGLNELSQREGVTLFMTLLAAFYVLLYRYSGQSDICVGSPVANRNRLETECLIGCLVNTLVLRTSVSGRIPFTALIHRVRDTVLGALAHQDLPFERLVQEINPERRDGHTPFFQVMFVMQNAPAAAIRLDCVEVTPAALDTMTAKFDLTLTVTEESGGLTAAFDYSTDLFSLETVSRLLCHYVRVLEGVVAAPESCIGAVPLLGEEERRGQLFG
ncbi:MAG TPA: condensation domain-containing protein, partial [Methylocella sp.]|nr:condensation domain-containing protein [Methylocella sp.]